MPKQKITMPILKELNELYDAGATVKQLMKKYNVCKKTITNYIWNMRCEADVEPVYLDDKAQMKIEINEVYNEGFTMKETAKLLRLSTSTVCKYVLNKRKQGVARVMYL